MRKIIDFARRPIGFSLVAACSVVAILAGGLKFAQRYVNNYNCGLQGHALPPRPGEQDDRYRHIDDTKMWSETKKVALYRISQYSDTREAWCSLRRDRRVRLKLNTYSEVDRNAEHALVARAMILDANNNYLHLAAASIAVPVAVTAYSVAKIVTWEKYSPASFEEFSAGMKGYWNTLIGKDGWNNNKSQS